MERHLERANLRTTRAQQRQGCSIATELTWSSKPISWRSYGCKFVSSSLKRQSRNPRKTHFDKDLACGELVSSWGILNLHSPTHQHA